MHIANRVDAVPDLTPEQLKASIVRHIAERLEFYRAQAVSDRSVGLTMKHSQLIVDAVLALTKGKL